MTKPPETLDGALVLMFTPVDYPRIATGATRHFVAGSILTSVEALAIAQYSGEASFYLFYCASDWQVLTDTIHNSVSEAQEQAEFEFQGTSKSWHPR